MRDVVEEEWVWAELAESWGGHLHRSILRIALSEASDEIYVNIVPVVLQVMHEDASDRLGPQARSLNFLSALDDLAEESIEGGSLEYVERAMCYFDQADFPGWILGNFGGLRRDYLEDKYFYSRDGWTGERRSPAKFLAEPDFDD